MRISRARCSLGVGALLLGAGCAEKSSVKPAADSGMPIVAAASTGSAADCPATGLWAECSLLKRLEQAAFAVHAESLTVDRHPPLSIAGKRLPIARGEIEIFVYADSGSRLRDAAKLDTMAFIPPSRQRTARLERTVVTNANLLVLMNVASEVYRERIANYLMAGPPQPPKNPPAAR
jgi:hypothetical protein